MEGIAKKSKETQMGSSGDRTQVLSWEEVLPYARLTFSVWVGQPELRWAKEAWTHLINAGLADYSDDKGWCMAWIKMYSLTSIYLDWCWFYADERNEYDWVFEVADRLDIDYAKFRALISIKPQQQDTFSSDKEFFETSVLKLMLDNHHRDPVYDALVEGFGDEFELYSSLLNSSRHEDDQISEEEVSAGSLDEMGEAWLWILDRCNSYR